MRKFAKCQNTEFRIFANNRIIAKFREIVLFSHHFRMFCIAKDAKFRFAWKPYLGTLKIDTGMLREAFRILHHLVKSHTLPYNLVKVHAY